MQCRGSGSGIWESVPFWPLDPGSGMGKNSDPGWTPGSYFRELWNHFFGLTYLNSLMRVRNPGWKTLGSVMVKFGSGINIPDPQHWPGFVHHTSTNIAFSRRKNILKKTIFAAFFERQWSSERNGDLLYWTLNIEQMNICNGNCTVSKLKTSTCDPGQGFQIFSLFSPFLIEKGRFGRAKNPPKLFVRNCFYKLW